MFRTSLNWREFELRIAALLAVSWFCYALFVSIANAQINAGRRLALVVGNTSYHNVTPLKNAVRDADAVSEALTNLGFEIVLLKNANASDIEAAVERIREKADDAEAILFYYSGHGFQMQGSNFLVPVDAVMRDRSKIAQETLRLDAIIASLQKKGRQTLVFLDACRNDPLPASVRAQTSGQGLAQLKTGKGTFVAFATQPGNVTADGAGDRSPFTNAFVEHVETPGISISDMMIRIRNTVEENTLQRQTPWDQSSLRSQFYFNPADEEQEELSEETLELLASLDPKLRKKFAEQFGIQLPDEEEDDVPVETVRPRLSIAPVRVKVDPKPKPTVKQTQATPEPKKPVAPRLALSPALTGESTGARNPESGGDLGISGTVVIAQPNFRPPPGKEQQKIVVLIPSERGPVRSTARISSEAIIAKQLTASNRVRATSPAASNRVAAAGSPDAANPVQSAPAPGSLSVPTPESGNSVDSAEEVASLRPVDGDKSTRSAKTLMRSLPQVGLSNAGVKRADGTIMLQPVAPSSTRIIGEDVTPAPPKPKEEPVQLAAINPQEVKPQEAPAVVPAPESVPENLPLAIQQELYRLGCYRNSRDGIWGNNSAKALLRYYLQKKESPDLIDPEPQLYAKLSAEEKVICERTEPAKSRRKVTPSRKKKPAARVARVRPSSKKAVKSRASKRSRPTKKQAKSGRNTARKSSGGGGRRIKKIKKLGGAFR
ncbi:MAG: caspase family protein [Rhizobiaceae bacterium]